MENPKDSTRKLLELITEYSQVAGYMFNTHKSLVFLITNSEKLKVSPKIRSKTWVPTVTTIIYYNFESPSQGSQRRKRNKRNPDQ